MQRHCDMTCSAFSTVTEEKYGVTMLSQPQLGVCSDSGSGGNHCSGHSLHALPQVVSSGSPGSGSGQAHYQKPLRAASRTSCRVPTGSGS